MEAGAQGDPQRIDGQRGRVLADIRFAAKEALAAMPYHGSNEAPKRQPA